MRIYMPNAKRTDPSTQRGTMQRMTWEQICRDDSLRGRWVAMDECSFDEATGRATEGMVVDADDDLAELCSRLRDSQWKNCSIVFADMRGVPPRNHLH